jgi:xylulokinase
VADEIGLAAGTPVVIGGGDGVCASTGAGVVAEGSAYNYVGSSSWIALATPEPIYDPDYRTFTYCHLVPGMYMPTGTIQSAGASYQWTRDNVCRLEVQTAELLNIQPYELMDLEAGQSPVGANGLLFLPHLMGERSPHWNPKAKGAFIGLTIRHTRADIIRAVLEGVSMNLCSILQAFLAQDADVKTMRLIGGGARARFWNQIMADVYGIPVYRMSILEEATSMGAALAGGIGVGLYPDFSLADSMNPVEEVIEPDAEAHAAYRSLMQVFFESYEVLVPVFDKLHNIKH